MHLEVDRSCGLKHGSGIEFGHSPIRRNVREGPASGIRMAVRPGHQYPVAVANLPARQDRRASGVWIDIDVDRLPCSRILQVFDRFPRTSPIRRSGAFVVGNQERQPRHCGGFGRFPQAFHDTGRFVAHVRGVDSHRFRNDTPDLCNLLRVRGGVRGIIETGGKAGCALLLAFCEQFPHYRDLCCVRPSGDVIHHRQAQRRMADKRDDIDRRPGLGDRCCVGGHCRELVRSGPAEQAHRRRRLVPERHRCQRDSAVSDNDGRNALTDLEGHARLVQHSPVVMRMGVDEARCQGQPGQVDFGDGPQFGKLARAPNRCDPAVRHRNLAGEFRSSCSVMDPCIPEHCFNFLHAPPYTQPGGRKINT